MLLKKILPVVLVAFIAFEGCEKGSSDEEELVPSKKDTVFVDVLKEDTVFIDKLRIDTVFREPLIDLSEVELLRIRQTSALCFIEIDDEKVKMVDELGVAWSSKQNVNIDTNMEGSAVLQEVVEENQIDLSGLLSGMKYFYRAYAQTTDTIYYSNEFVFETIAIDGTTGTVTDIDGNVYETIIIGGVEWMLENLQVKHYRDGSPIVADVSVDSWNNLREGAMGIFDYMKISGYESDSAVLVNFGALYNWYAVDDERGLSPEGWHVPTDEEMQELEMFLGMKESQAQDTDMRGSDQGAQMKSKVTYPALYPRWDNGNIATNTSSLSIIAAGARYENGSYGYKGFHGYLWTSSEVGTSNAWGRNFTYYESKIGRNIMDKNLGFSIRCIKDNL